MENSRPKNNTTITKRFFHQSPLIQENTNDQKWSIIIRHSFYLKCHPWPWSVWLEFRLHPERIDRLWVTKERNVSHCCFKNEQRGLNSPLCKGDTHQGSPSITNKDMTPQTQQLKFANEWAQDKNALSWVCSPGRVVMPIRNSRNHPKRLHPGSGCWRKMSRVSGSSRLGWAVQCPFSSTAVLSRVWWIQGVIPGTLTAVGVVSTINCVWPFPGEGSVCYFQSFTHTKSPGEYGCTVVSRENGILF